MLNLGVKVDAESGCAVSVRVTFEGKGVHWNGRREV